MKWLILQLASSSLLRLGQDQADKDAIRNSTGNEKGWGGLPVDTETKYYTVD